MKIDESKIREYNEWRVMNADEGFACMKGYSDGWWGAKCEMQNDYYIRAYRLGRIHKQDLTKF